MKEIYFLRSEAVSIGSLQSLPSAAFSDQQDSALADCLQASVMLQYNKR